MGAWGFGTFENDSALDFLDDLRRSDPSEFPEVASSRLSLASDYIDDEEGSHALVVTEFVAAVLDGQRDGIPEEHWDLLPSFAALSLEILPHAAASLLTAMLNNSETRELRAEGEADDDAAWLRSTQILISRLQGE